MRKLKERKLAKSASYSPSNSPNPGATGSSSSISGSNSSNGNNSNSNNCNGSSNARLKSLSDALTSDNFEHHERSNNSPSSRHPSPARAGTSGEGRRGSGGSPPKRSKKQSAKHRNPAALEQDKPQNHRSDSGSSAATVQPPVVDKHVTPLPGFQQAFGSTEIGKFSEAFFNSSPGPNSGDLHHLPPEAGGGQHHPHHHHQHHHPHPHAHQLIMDSLATAACESDVDTLSPQPCWEPTGPGDPFDGAHSGGTTAFNLQIGTSFHPSYYETSSTYSATSDHVVDSPLGSYFSEMTCNEYVT